MAPPCPTFLLARAEGGLSARDLQDPQRQGRTREPLTASGIAEKPSQARGAGGLSPPQAELAPHRHQKGISGQAPSLAVAHPHQTLQQLPTGREWQAGFMAGHCSPGGKSCCLGGGGCRACRTKKPPTGPKYCKPGQGAQFLAHSPTNGADFEVLGALFSTPAPQLQRIKQPEQGPPPPPQLNKDSSQP